jgi:nucleotide-binding universal stress UspA family protein
MFGKIVLAVDGTETSNRALDLVREIAIAMGSEVVAVHVREEGTGPGGERMVEAREEARDILDMTIASLTDAGVNVRGQLWPSVQADIATQIVDVAQQEDADLIVLGSRGRDGIGAVAHRALQMSVIPVLAVA